MTENQSIEHPALAISQIFLESAEFTHRGDFLNLPSNTRPQPGEVDVEVQTGVSEDGRGGMMRVEVRTSDKSEALYSFRVAVIVQVQLRPGTPETVGISAFLERSVLQMLFPFAREAVANLTMRGRFGPIWLQPIIPSRNQATEPKSAKTPATAQPARPRQKPHDRKRPKR